jgi:twitching motility protein PilI
VLPTLVNAVTQPDPAALDAPRPPVQTLEGVGQWVGVRVAAWSIAVPVASLHEIRRPPPLVRVPGVMPWLVGVAALQAQLVPVTHLARFLLDEAPRTGPDTRLLLAWRGACGFGLLVEQVFGLIDLEDGDTRPVTLSAPVPARLAACVEGTRRGHGGTWTVLDLGALFALRAFGSPQAESVP